MDGHAFALYRRNYRSEVCELAEHLVQTYQNNSSNACTVVITRREAGGVPMIAYTVPLACINHCYGSEESVAFVRAKTNQYWGADCNALMSVMRLQR